MYLHFPAKALPTEADLNRCKRRQAASRDLLGKLIRPVLNSRSEHASIIDRKKHYSDPLYHMF